MPSASTGSQPVLHGTVHLRSSLIPSRSSSRCGTQLACGAPHCPYLPPRPYWVSCYTHTFAALATGDAFDHQTTAAVRLTSHSANAGRHKRGTYNGLKKPWDIYDAPRYVTGYQHRAWDEYVVTNHQFDFIRRRNNTRHVPPPQHPTSSGSSSGSGSGGGSRSNNNGSSRAAAAAAAGATQPTATTRATTPPTPASPASSDHPQRPA
jgi:hypothetical protein